MRMRSLSKGRETAVFGHNLSLSGAGGYFYNIIYVVPSSVFVGSPLTVIQILAGGVNAFNANTQPYLNGVAVTAGNYTLVNPGRIDVTIPASMLTTPGIITIQVKDLAAPALRFSNVVFFGVEFPLPTLATISVTVAFFGQVPATLTATGTGYYTPQTTAAMNGVNVGFAYVSPTSGTVTIPPSVSGTIGDYQVTITNPPPGGGTTVQRLLQVRYRAPVVTTINPTYLYAGRPSGTITINGQASPTTFYAASTVEVDGVTVPSNTTSGSTITFAFPEEISSVPGTKEVRVRNPTGGGGGGLSGPLSFSFVLQPVLITLDITEVVQYFDGFDVKVQLDQVDANFTVTYNDVPQPTTFIDAQTLVAHVTSAACAVPGTTMVRVRDNISGISTNAIPFVVSPWTPAKIGSAMRLWLDGTSLVDDGSGRALTWTDMSGGSRNLTQATPGKRPLIVASGLNGRPVARFDNVRADTLGGITWLTIGAAGVINKLAYNIWVVASGNINNATVLGETNGYIHTAGFASSGPSLTIRDDSGAANILSAPYNWSGGVPFALRARKDTANIYNRVNRNTEFSVAHGLPAAFAPVAFIMGGTMKGDVAEVIICNADLNYTFKAILDNMLSYKYGLPFAVPGTAPTITSVSPISVTQLDLPFVFDVYDTGNSFTAGSIVNVVDTPLATTYLTAGHLQARMPQAQTLLVGGRAITVADVGGISGPRGISILPYTDVPGPNLYSITPITTYQFGAQLTAQLNGTGFTASSVAYWNSTPCTTIFHDAGYIEAVIPVQALDVLPGPVITVHDGAFVSNGLELTLTPWSPASIAGISMWLRADDVVMGTGSGVQQMNDRTGRGQNVLQATASKQPLLIASDPNFNGKPSLNFDGADDAMSGPQLNNILFDSTVSPIQCQLAVVFRPDTITGSSATPTQNQVVMGGGGSNVGFSLRNTPQAQAFVNDGSYRTATNTNIAPGQTSQCVISIAGLSVGLSINGVAGTPAAYVSTIFGAQIFSLGGMNTLVSPFLLDGQIAEVVTSYLSWSAQDLICWKNYCRSRYGTP
jgi:hypothetical protein